MRSHRLIAQCRLCPACQVVQNPAYNPKATVLTTTLCACVEPSSACHANALLSHACCLQAGSHQGSVPEGVLTGSALQPAWLRAHATLVCLAPQDCPAWCLLFMHAPCDAMTWWTSERK